MDYSKLTNDELDKLIAEKRGWKIVSVTSAFSLQVTKDVWINPSGYAENMPSFTTDPRYAMELLKEMNNCSLKRWGDKWCCGVYNDKGYLENQATMYYTPERAIAEAWLQWRENE